MADYGTNFSASYNPNLQTSLTMSGPGVEYGSGSGSLFGLDLDSILQKVYDWKQRAAAQDFYRQQQGAQADAARQAYALRQNANLGQQLTESERALQNSSPVMRGQTPMGQQLQAKALLDQYNEANPAFAHGQGLLGTNGQYFNLPAAASMTTGKDPYTSGWETYANLLGHGYDPKSGPENQALWGSKSDQFRAQADSAKLDRM